MVQRKKEVKISPHDAAKAASNVLNGVQSATSSAEKAVSNVTTSEKDKVIGALDQNGNGSVDIEDIIILGLKTPGVKINRATFLRSEFKTTYPKSVVNKAIETTPEQAGIEHADIDKVANDVINHERIGVSGISTALGMPGGVAMVATIPADIVQYYGFMLRAAQELMYLYGFPEINLNEKEGVFDSQTINTLILCLGVMYGVAGANNAIKAMAKGLATGVQKKLMQTALTKGTVYPIVKSVSKWFGVHMTKEVFAGFFKKAIPVVGGVVGGGLTFVTFKPCCERLKKSLKDTALSNKKHQESKEEQEIFDAMITKK